jgi:hypothetical protein
VTIALAEPHLGVVWARLCRNSGHAVRDGPSRLEFGWRPVALIERERCVELAAIVIALFQARLVFFRDANDLGGLPYSS